MKRRHLALWFPRLAADLAAKRRRVADPAAAGSPLIVVAKIKGAQRLVGLDTAAEKLGLHVGLSLGDARARHAKLVVADSDPAAEAALLGRAADWCARYTPLVALDGADGLMLDVTGVAHLFGGEAALVADAAARLKAQGFDLRWGLADFPRAAWALARFAPARIMPVDLSERDFAKQFHGLPLAALGISAECVADLAKAGLRRVGDVALRPRAPIAARYGSDVLDRLDGLRGLRRESICPRFPVPEFSAERKFASPLVRVDAVEAQLAKLSDDLVVMLERRGRGARRLELSLFRTDGVVRRIRVGASRPLNEARAILRLFSEKLASRQEDEIDVGFGVDLMRLDCPESDPFVPSQRDFERAHEADRADALADLLDRLAARLGAHRVMRRRLVADHRPEAAEAEILRGETPTPTTPADMPPAESRPLRILRRAEPIEAVAEAPDGPPLLFRWRRNLHEVVAVEGPERIAPAWRRGGGAGDLSRDYFRAEDRRGRRFWLYREGLYGEETARARWYLHGLFA